MDSPVALARIRAAPCGVRCGPLLHAMQLTDPEFNRMEWVSALWNIWRVEAAVPQASLWIHRSLCSADGIYAVPDQPTINRIPTPRFVPPIANRGSM